MYLISGIGPGIRYPVGSGQWVSYDFRAPPQTTCLGPLPRVYGDYFLANTSPSTPRAPRGRGACGALATPLDPVFLSGITTIFGNILVS